MIDGLKIELKNAHHGTAVSYRYWSWNSFLGPFANGFPIAAIGGSIPCDLRIKMSELETEVQFSK